MFGELWEPRDYSTPVEDGTYTVTIKDVTPEQKGSYSTLRIDIEIEGHENCTPRYWTLFDRPQGDDKKAYWWDVRMTKFCDAFGINTDHALNPAEWLGKKGKVIIGKNQKTGYTEVLEAVVVNPQPHVQQNTGAGF